ncbi:Zinc finger FYVE domain-containing protein 26 [Holothuria leucospilota]|uniref:Zinc finger FYVE domain-containing protein 26 n=1 Tax=Holothuria leucospilota TaxID=206669 RepID=A0A9Q1CFX0_HOLLE|nr:Zinc finger FYVE domain-containing protein 26 [Holothuria leucospilota]
MAGAQSSKSLPDGHPFGDEEEVSKIQLFVALCNNLQLGQWELARACILSLYARKEDKCDSTFPAVDDLLKALVENPHKTCFGSDSLPSPVHLSWHCSQLLQTLTNSENLLPEDFQYKAEFLMLLLKVHAENSPSILQELFLFFNELLTEKQHPGRLHYKPSLSRQALQFIQKTLSQNPNLGHSLVSQLLLPGNPAFQTSNQSLQKLYSVCIKDILAEIRKDIANNKVETPDFSSRLDSFLSLLSRWNPAQQTSDSQLEKIFSEILEILSKVGNNGLYLRAQSSLLGRDSTLMPCFYNTVDCQRVLEVIDEEVARGRSDLKGCTQQTRVLVGLSLKEDRQKAWQTYLSLVLKSQSHVLGQIIETSLAFIQDGLFEDMTALLEPLEFQPLKPVILLVGWNYVSSSTSAENLIKALHLDEMQCRDPLLNEACTKLLAQVASMRWCLETVRPLLPSPSHQSALEARASRMFQDLDSSSILSMVHRLTGLGQLDKDVVFKLLKQTPLIGHKGSKANSKQSKSVHFADDDETDLTPEQRRDVSIYSSFLVMKNFLEALLTAVPYTPKLTGDLTTDVKPEVQLSTADSQWEHFVDERLGWVEKEMCGIYPLSYRVEILENLFSLLFLRYEDLIDGKDLNADSDEEEGLIEDDLTNLSITSLESIASPLKDIPFNQMLESRPEYGKVVKKIDFGDETMENSVGESRTDGTVLQKEILGENASPIIPDGSEISLDNVRRKEFILGREMGEVHPPLEGNTASHVSTESMSQQSHISSKQIGFIANDAVTRKLLMTLKNCLGDVSKEKMALYGISAYNKIPHEKDSLLRYLDTSVPLPQLAQRIANLTQCINEAWWRYQLVSEGSVIKGAKGQEDGWSSDEDMDRLGDVLVEETSVRSSKSKKKRRRSKSKTASGISSSGKESGSQSALSQLSADNRFSNDGAQSGNGRTRGHRKRRRRVRSETQPLAASYDRSIVARMLSTGDTLLKMCYRKGNYSQASQVVKMFGMDDKPDATEVQFSQKWERAVQQLQSLEGKSRTEQQRLKQSLSSSSRRSKIGGIATMAAAGMMSTSVTGIIDMLLTCSDLPSLPKLQDLNVRESPSSLERTIYDQFQRLSIPVMIILDLACSYCNSRQSCRDLIEMAISRLKNVKEQMSVIESPKEDGNSHIIVGVGSFLQQLHQLMNLSPTAVAQNGKQPLLSENTLAARGLLTEGRHPLTPSGYQTCQKRLSDLSSRISQLENLLTDESNEQLEVMQLMAESSSTVGLETVQKVSGYLLQSLDKATGFVYTNGSRVKEEDGSSQQSFNYFFSLFKHACILASLQLEAQDWHPDHDKELKGGVFNACNPFIVFQQSPSVLLGQMMFENKIPPVRLEDVADKLKLNLVRIIIQSCCPTIPVSPHLPTLQQPSRKSQEAFIYKPCSGVYVLNETAGVQNEETTARHPVLVARELLTRMVTFMKSQCVNTQDPNLFDLQSAAKASCHPEFHSIQIACQELAYVDLNLLTSNAEKTCFFTNVLNLMLVHASLHHVYDEIMSKQKKKMFTPSHTRHRSLTVHPVPSVEGIKPPTSHTSMTLDLLTHLCKYSYRIGQMGVVSAFDLEFVVLRHRLPAPSVFSHILNDRIVDIHISDPWYKFLPAADTRLVFVITNGCISSPILTVLHEEDVEEQLDILMQQYLDNFVEVDDVKHEFGNILYNRSPSRSC